MGYRILYFTKKDTNLGLNKMLIVVGSHLKPNSPDKEDEKNINGVTLVSSMFSKYEQELFGNR